MQTTSSRALLHRSPSSCQLLYRTSGCRTSTPPGRVTICPSVSAICFSISLFFFLIITISLADSVVWCLPQRVLLGGHFGHRGHFPVRLRRQAVPQPQQGVRTLTADTTAAGGGPVEASRHGGERRTEDWRKRGGKVFIIYCDRRAVEEEERRKEGWR